MKRLAAIAILGLLPSLAWSAPKCPDPVPQKAETKLLCKGTHTLDLPCFCVDRTRAEAAYLYMQAEKDGEVSFNSGWPMWTVICAAVAGFGLGAGAGVYVATKY